MYVGSPPPRGDWRNDGVTVTEANRLATDGGTFKGSGLAGTARDVRPERQARPLVGGRRQPAYS